MRTVTSSIALVALIALVAGAVEKKPERVSASDVGSKIVIVGRLGVPLGHEVVIHGEKITNGPLRDCFFVDAVDGKKLERKTTVQIRGIENWPDKQQASIRGYEAGVVRYSQARELNLSPNNPRFKQHQTVYLSFYVVKIVEPDGLTLDTK
jgi:hypothetical protein